MRKRRILLLFIVFCISFVHPESSGADQLINACMTGDLARVKALLAKSADVNVTDSAQRTPLMWASLFGHDKIAGLLLEKGADVHHKDQNMETAFSFAGTDGEGIFNWQGKLRTMKLLLKYGADPYTDGLIFFRESVERGYWEIAKGALEQTKNKDLKKKYLTASIIGACRSNNVSLAKVLLAEVNDVNIRLADADGDTPLIAAVGNRELVQLILEKGGDIHISNNDGITPLMKACNLFKPDLSAIKLLLSKGAKVNGRSKEGHTPLMLAIHDDGTDLNLLNLLLKNGADINAVDKDNSSALYHAYGGKTVNWDVMEYLLNKGADLGSRNGSKEFFFERMYRGGFHEIFKKFLKYIACSSRIKTDGPVAFCYAARAGYMDIVKQFLDNGVHVNARDGNGLSALMHSVLEKRTDVMAFLLKRHADIELKDNNGRTALILAARQDNADIVKQLVNAGADINATDSDGRTALMGDKKRSSPALDVMQILINMGIKVNTRDNDGMTALSDIKFPDTEEEWQKITLLIKNGADVNIADNNRRSILMTAYQHNRMGLVRLILEKGGDIRKRYQNGKTIWAMVCTDRNQEMAGYLLSFMEDANFTDSDGTTPLMYACAFFEDSEFVERLLEKGADVNASSASGKTALMVASENGCLRSVEALLKAKIHINTQTKKGWSALMWAAEKGHTKIVKLLVNAGADINATNKSGKTALQIAEMNRHFETVKYLSKAKPFLQKLAEWDYALWLMIILCCGTIIILKQRGRKQFKSKI